VLPQQSHRLQLEAAERRLPLDFEVHRSACALFEACVPLSLPASMAAQEKEASGALLR
jgi:hypothetical protein